VRAKARHIVPKVGARLPIDGVDVTVISSGGEVLSKPLRGAGSRNAACRSGAIPAQETIENPRSTGVVLQFGRFRFLDVGDLTGRRCTRSRVPPIASVLSTCISWRTTAGWMRRSGDLRRSQAAVAVMNNAEQKGGGAETFAALHDVPGMRSGSSTARRTPAARNFDDATIANVTRPQRTGSS